MMNSAGRCIEVWSGQTFREVFLQHNLFTPLGNESWILHFPHCIEMAAFQCCFQLKKSVENSTEKVGQISSDRPFMFWMQNSSFSIQSSSFPTKNSSIVTDRSFKLASRSHQKSSKIIKYHQNYHQNQTVGWSIPLHRPAEDGPCAVSTLLSQGISHDISLVITL